MGHACQWLLRTRGPTCEGPCQNGFGNEYYTAGVLSMTQSWRNFLYHAFDPAGFVSIDKPPLAAWIQVASVKLFGFHGLAVLVPQVLEGVAAVWLVHHLVQRRVGRSAGLLAGLFLALTPVSVAVDRSSNTESCLILVLLLAAWALLRAAEDGSRGFLLLSMALVGLAFNVTMLAAFVVLPAFALVYLLLAGDVDGHAGRADHHRDRRAGDGPRRLPRPRPDPDPDMLARMVDAREVRFVMLNDLSLVSRRLGAEAAGQPIADSNPLSSRP